MGLVNAWTEREKHGNNVNLRLQYMKRSQLPDYVQIQEQKQPAQQALKSPLEDDLLPESTPVDQEELEQPLDSTPTEKRGVKRDLEPNPSDNNKNAKLNFMNE